MLKKNSLTKTVCSFHINLEGGRRLKDFFKNAGLTEGAINQECDPNSAN